MSICHYQNVAEHSFYENKYKEENSWKTGWKYWPTEGDESGTSFSDGNSDKHNPADADKQTNPISSNGGATIDVADTDAWWERIISNRH